MSESDNEKKLSEALVLVDKYERYRLMKSWGMFTGIISILVFIKINSNHFFWFITGLLLLLLKIEPNSPAWKLIISAFFLILNLLPAIISMIITFYLYRSVKKTSVDGNEITSSRYTLFGSAMLSMWLFSFFLPFFIFLSPIMQQFFYFFGDSLGCFIAYFILNIKKDNSDKSRHFGEILYLGLAVLALNIAIDIFMIPLRALLPGYGIIDPIRVFFPEFIYTDPVFRFYFSIDIIILVKSALVVSCFIISSYVSLKKASRVLKGESRN